MKRLFFAIILCVGASEPVVRDRVVLVPPDRVLEGEVERANDRVLIRRGESTTSIPAQQAIFIGPDKKSALRFLQSRTDLAKPEERLRLARWCHENGLKSEAINEVDAVLEMKPNWLPALTLKQQFKQTSGNSPTPKSAEPIANPADAVDCSTEALKLFGTKVQPVLMNACVHCHASGRCGKFELRRVNTIGPVNQNDSQFNLASASKHIDRQNLSKSPLLVKAITPHGGMNHSPIKDTNAPPFKHLEQWVKMVAENRPSEPASKAEGSRPAGPKDEFDPRLFNRNIDG